MAFANIEDRRRYIREWQVKQRLNNPDFLRRVRESSRKSNEKYRVPSEILKATNPIAYEKKISGSRKYCNRPDIKEKQKNDSNRKVNELSNSYVAQILRSELQIDDIDLSEHQELIEAKRFLLKIKRQLKCKQNKKSAT